MKKILALMMVLITVFALCGCSGDDTVQGAADSGTATVTNVDYSFTNIYGDKDTICIHPECAEDEVHIAYKGETAFCANHSNICPVCYTFIMPDQLTCSNPECIAMANAAAEAEADKAVMGEPEDEEIPTCPYRIVQNGVDADEIAPCGKVLADGSDFCITHAVYMEPALAVYQDGLKATFNNNKGAFEGSAGNDSDRTCQFVVGNQNICGDNCVKDSNFCEYHTAIMNSICDSLTNE